MKLGYERITDGLDEAVRARCKAEGVPFVHLCDRLDVPYQKGITVLEYDRLVAALDDAKDAMPRAYWHMTMDEFSADTLRRYLVSVLYDCGGNVTRAAGVAGVDVKTFRRHMKKLGVTAER